jgi:hypothetical protein
VSDNGSGVSSLYNTAGQPLSLVVADRPRLQRGASPECLRDLGRDGRRRRDYRPGRFGNGGNGGDPNTLYFTAGPNGESDGLFGSLTPDK